MIVRWRLRNERVSLLLSVTTVLFRVIRIVIRQVRSGPSDDFIHAKLLLVRIFSLSILLHSSRFRSSLNLRLCLLLLFDASSLLYEIQLKSLENSLEIRKSFATKAGFLLISNDTSLVIILDRFA